MLSRVVRGVTRVTGIGVESERALSAGTLMPILSSTDRELSSSRTATVIS